MSKSNKGLNYILAFCQEMDMKILGSTNSGLKGEILIGLGFDVAIFRYAVSL